MDLISYLLKLEDCKLSKIEKLLLEIKLLTEIFNELYEIFNNRYKAYQVLLKSNKENNMFGINITQEMIKDILATEEYSLAGIATSTCIPEEVLYEVASGINNNPTLEVSRKLFELHMTVRRNLYDTIMQKILSSYHPHT